MKMLKNTLVLFAFATLTFTSCKKDDPKPATMEYRKPVASERE